MSEVKRYDPFGYDGLSAMMHEDAHGDWVRGEDYDALQSRLDAALIENRILRSTHDDQVSKFAEAKTELRQQLAERDAVLRETADSLRCSKVFPALLESIDALLSSAEPVKAEFCCELSFKAAKQAAWDARRMDRCKCDHNEYCDHCFPEDFRPGGKWHGGFVAQQSAHVSVPRELLDAVKELFDAKQAKEDFERENPGNSTKRWDACLYRIDAAEDALRDLLNGGEA